MASNAFGAQKRPAGKEFRDGTVGEVLDDLYSDIDAGFTAVEDGSALSLDGTAVGTVADDNTEGGILLIHRVDIANATADTDVVLTHKTRVVNVWVNKTGTSADGGDTVTVKNGANAITNTIALNVSDNALVPASSISKAQHEIAAAGTLKISANSSSDCACTVYIMAVRVA